jgi:hypothetical protein
MRRATGSLAFAVAAAVVAACAARAGAAAPAPFADTICPEAAQYVTTLRTLTPADPPLKISDASHAVSAAYETCAKRKLSDQDVEPGVHYAYTREAAFEVLEARALLAQNRPADAKAVLENSRRLASDVFEWRRPLGPNDAGAKDTRPSLYQSSAKDVLDAVNALLAKLNAPPASGTPAPKP